MPYFHINHGLRGCYMPDGAYVLKAETRKALKDAIKWEAESYKDAGYVGANKKAIAWLAAECWRNRGKASLDYCLPLAPEHSRKNYAFGIFCSAATRRDYVEYVKENP